MKVMRSLVNIGIKCQPTIQAARVRIDWMQVRIKQGMTARAASCLKTLAGKLSELSKPALSSCVPQHDKQDCTHASHKDRRKDE